MEDKTIFSGHGPGYIYDNVAFAVSLTPFFLVAALLVAGTRKERLWALVERFAELRVRLLPRLAHASWTRRSPRLKHE